MANLTGLEATTGLTMCVLGDEEVGGAGGGGGGAATPANDVRG